MNIAYVFATDMSATYKLGTMILPQLEAGTHGVNVVGMFFFDDNLFCLREGDEVGERLAKVAAEQNILLMVCDQCAVRRNLAEGTFEQCGSGDVTAKGPGGRSKRRLLPAALHGARPRRARPRHHAVGPGESTRISICNSSVSDQDYITPPLRCTSTSLTP